MRMLQEFYSKIDAIGTIGGAARADARARGISSYYIDPENPSFIVEERPDGSKILTPADGPEVRAEAAE